MPKAAIHFAESPVTDIQAVGDWHANQRAPEVGEQLLQQIVARIEGLADQPAMGRMVPEFAQPFQSELIQPPFRTVYRYDPDLKLGLSLRSWLLRSEGKMPLSRRESSVRALIGRKPPARGRPALALNRGIPSGAGRPRSGDSSSVARRVVGKLKLR